MWERMHWKIRSAITAQSKMANDMRNHINEWNIKKNNINGKFKMKGWNLVMIMDNKKKNKQI